MKAARLSHATARLAVAAAVPVLLAGLTSCSSDDDGATDAAASSAPTSADAGTTATPGTTGPFGPGCGIFPAEGVGSLAAVAAAPAGLAVSSVPDLSTLTQAVLAANLVDVLNTRPEVTVLAPSNAAFDALGPDALPALFADAPRLTALLTHHVVNGRLAPDELVGEHTTLNGDTVTVSGPPDAPTVAAEQTVAGAAAGTVLCGDVPTVNATVYVVDQVLTPAG